MKNSIQNVNPTEAQNASDEKQKPAIELQKIDTIEDLNNFEKEFAQKDFENEIFEF